MSKLIALGQCFGAPSLYQDMFDRTVFLERARSVNLSVIEPGDVVLYGGGEDISPSIYKGEHNRFTHAPAQPSERDAFEIEAFHRAREVGAFNYGICRGAQMLCALSGGTLIQHVNNHAGRDHFIVTNDGRKYRTSSAHHQMMWPFALPRDKFMVLASCPENQSDVYVFNEQDIKRQLDVLEPEVVWFPETRSLTIQGHPEFMNPQASLVRYTRELLQQYFLS